MFVTETRSNFIAAAVAAVLGTLVPGILMMGCGGELEGADPAASDPAQEELSAALGTGVARPSGVPDDFVATPHGWRHRSCVIQVSPDESVGGGGRIERSDGSWRSFARCGHPAFDRRGRMMLTPVEEPQANGWLASVSSTSTGAITSLTASWPVPRNPVLVQSQTLFFFPGVEPLATTDVILQPVLAWNGFGDNAWTIASWACCKDGNVFNSAPVSVSAGDNLTGTLTGAGCSRTTGVCSNWTVTTRDERTRRSTSFSAAGGGEKMDWVFGGAMEVYGIDTCNQNSASASFRFSNIRVRNAAGSFVAPSWGPWSAGSSASPDCKTVFGSPQVSGTTSSWLLSWSHTL